MDLEHPFSFQAVVLPRGHLHQDDVGSFKRFLELSHLAVPCRFFTIIAVSANWNIYWPERCLKISNDLAKLEQCWCCRRCLNISNDLTMLKSSTLLRNLNPPQPRTSLTLLALSEENFEWSRGAGTILILTNLNVPGGKEQCEPHRGFPEYPNVPRKAWTMKIHLSSSRLCHMMATKRAHLTSPTLSERSSYPSFVTTYSPICFW